MLIFLLLCALIRTLQGAPLAPSHFPAEDLINFVARDGPETSCDGGQNLRTRFSVVQSCLLTIVACVWKAIHPNINGETDSGWTRLKRKITTTLIALIAPEMIFYWALKQRIAAKKIAEEYNEEFVKVGVEVAATIDSDAEMPLWRKTVACLKGYLLAYFCSIQSFFRHRSRDDRRRWTTTHGFFVQMGGFILEDRDGSAKGVLVYWKLFTLIQDKSIDRPTVTERELQDRSKGDVISKGIVVWQTTWFAIQCCARLVQHLPLSELEVVTLAFTVVNVAIYAAWWDKPQSVDSPIRLQLKESANGINSTNTASNNSAEMQQSTAGDAHPDNSSDAQLLIPEGKPSDEKERWLRRKLREDRQTHGLLIFLTFRLPYRVAQSGWHYTFDKLLESNTFDGESLRMPMFYAEKDFNSDKAEYSFGAIGFMFGAIHFFAWGSVFPSRTEQVLWRCSAIALVAFPSFAVLIVLFSDVRDRFDFSNAARTALELLGKGLLWVSCFLILLYIPARLIMIILALKAIRQPSPAILQDVSWTSFIPHL